MSGVGHDGMAASADAVARLQHDHREAGTFQRMRRTEAGGAGTDDGDIDFGGEGRHAFGSSFGLKANSTTGVIIRESG